ncbi:MAG TPA: hypothetical protein VI636_17545 [Candidatus Angelobacter sp.]
MAISIEIHNAGGSAEHAEITAAIEHVLSDRAGDWRASILGSQANDQWEMKVHGPNGFERSYTLDGSAGQHQPSMIRGLLERILPPKAHCSG